MVKGNHNWEGRAVRLPELLDEDRNGMVSLAELKAFQVCVAVLVC